MSELVQIAGTKPSGREYWRSLEELAGTARFQQWVEKEFPGGVELMSSGSRRTVLKIMAAAFGLAGLTACRRPVERILPATKGIEDLVPGAPMFYASAFVHGGAASGVLVESHDYRPTKIEGNRNHPYSLGAASAFAQASLLGLYDPDRMQRVLRHGQPSSWKDFEDYARELAGKLGDGAGLRILAGRLGSPSLEAVKTHLLGKFPSARWVEFDSVNDAEALRGTALAFGRPLQAHYRFDKARVVVSLDSDFLLLDSPTILPVKQFSATRRADENGGGMSRLYVVESNFTTTGAMADHRLRTRAADVAGVALALAAKLNIAGDALNVLQPASAGAEKVVSAMAADLAANRGASIVIAGPRQPAAVHALALAINQALGNLGETVTFTRPLSETTEPAGAIAALASEMSRGAVDTLLVIGGNPVYAAPADVDFAGALKKVPNSIHLSVAPNETSVACQWQLPESHYLESWGDPRALDGTVSIQQPLVDRLFESRTPSELLALLSGYQDAKAYDIVRNYWLKQPQTNDEAKWRKAVCDGVVEASAFATETATADGKAVVAAARSALKPVPAGMEVVFYPNASVWDGSYANNAWMQEMPEPITKLVWDNAALLSPKTAKSLGVETGDVLRISKGEHSVEIAAMVLPGHADNSLSLSLGFGRTVCGRVGDGLGVNVGPLRTAKAFSIATGVDVSNGGRTYKLVTAQEHFRMEGRPIIREGTLTEYHDHPDFAEKMEEAREANPLFPDWDYSKGYQWGMAIDLNACIGCNACAVACQAENNIPTVGKEQVGLGREMHWIRLDRYFTGGEDDPQSLTQPMACQQCEIAPCESVCPVAATSHSPEGLNDMVYNRCIGTRYCSNNCPYKVRRFNFLNWHKNLVEIEKMVFNPDVTVRERGVMEKCTYCVQRIEETKIAARAEGRAAGGKPRTIKDGEILTACQQTCPADAIVFGNINDAESRVAKLKRSARNYAVLSELRTKPRTTYLARLRNPNPEVA